MAAARVNSNPVTLVFILHANHAVAVGLINKGNIITYLLTFLLLLTVLMLQAQYVSFAVLS